MDKDCIDRLIALGSDPASIQRIQDLAAREMKRAGLGYTLHNACAATLSQFLIAAGVNVPVTLGAGKLAARLGPGGRGWDRVAVGGQRAGDVGVTVDNTAPAGADHIYLVVERVDADEMVIADNQAPNRHARFASGQGKTRTDYFLRAPEARGFIAMDRLAVDDAATYPDQDEDSNDLPEPFADDGGPTPANVNEIRGRR
ncbi:hypothetical protein PMI01_00628 [Caulobacter sp. AP07]|uniref:hypothetical protein n=1 Tax=Caulobacter sp. AP07 TaxID=1144304 RepID=UPI000271ED50|nr:hypothetical protein [Caulobacter sp. AP07]EJL37550.1 hypothetical protein PMI01_00628 [Caulobacter sp. AP07]